MAIASWLELAQDSRKSASELANLGHARSAISRAYYACYSKLTHELTVRGVAMPVSRDGPAHKKLWLLIETQLRQFKVDRRFALSQLAGRFYDLRIWADYFPSVSINARDAREALGLMKKLFDAF